MVSGLVAFRESTGPPLPHCLALLLLLTSERDQVFQIPPEPIQPPAHQHVKPPPLGVAITAESCWTPNGAVS
jgi:hypothetical protein